MPRPDQVLLVAGTGTDVGKTWVASRLALELLRRSLRVGVRKPVQSFAPGPDAGPTDAEVLGAATGEPPTVVCPAHRWYELPLAPPMAADALGLEVPTLAELVDELAWPSHLDVGLVEAAGGVCSPLAGDGDTVGLAEQLAPTAIILVAHAGLGAINDVRLSVGALSAWPVIVFLNRFDPRDDVHRRNRVWFVDHDGIDLVVDVGAMAARHPSWCRPKP